MTKQKLFTERRAEEAREELRRAHYHIRVFSWSHSLPQTLWYHGRVPDEIDSYHEAARAVGLSNIIEGELTRSHQFGRHWLLLQGVK
jgi:hypothetical protein